MFEWAGPAPPGTAGTAMAVPVFEEKKKGGEKEEKKRKKRCGVEPKD